MLNPILKDPTQSGFISLGHSETVSRVQTHNI